jgi:hypothetical protein
MPNEFHFELKYSLESVNYLVTQGAQNIIISGKLTLDGNHVIEMHGETETLSRVGPAPGGGCPMPCSLPVPPSPPFEQS